MPGATGPHHRQHSGVAPLFQRSSQERAAFGNSIGEKLDEGRLPEEDPVAVWGSQGTFVPCDGCETKILPAQVEVSFKIKNEFFRFHRDCYELWDAERRRRGGGRLVRAIVEGGGMTCIDCTAAQLGMTTDALAAKLHGMQQHRGDAGDDAVPPL